MELFLLLILSLSFAGVTGQRTIKAYVEKNQVSIPYMDPDTPGYADLEAIGRSIGEARVVMLGEQSHGDATSFMAKSRLVKYLHEQKGFNVLVFEGDFFALNRGWDVVRKEKMDIDSFLLDNVPFVWTRCQTCKPLLNDYIPETYKTAHPLIVSGMDMQLLGRYSLNGHVTDELDSMARLVKLPMVGDPDYEKEAGPAIRNWYRFFKDSAGAAKSARFLEEQCDEFARQLGKDNFWSLVSRNMVEFYQMMRYMQSGKTDSASMREASMARNLHWLKDIKFPGEKIIVWGASVHITKWTSGPPAYSFQQGYLPMGAEFTRDSATNRQTYIMGFASYKGHSGRVNTAATPLYRPRAGSMEQWFNKSADFGFVDFRAYNDGVYKERAYNETAPDPYAEEFYLDGYGHVPGKAAWNKLFDGIFFIRNMVPCEKVF